MIYGHVTLLLTIFHFYLWKISEYTEKTSDLSKVTDKPRQLCMEHGMQLIYYKCNMKKQK